MNEPSDRFGWFAGPKAEHGELFTAMVKRILEDYYHWRRNYFPEDGNVIDAAARRLAEPFADRFQDKLQELLALLKGDFPFYSPRYAAHMLSEQTLPSIAGYFAGMVYNPNNVTSEAAPVTVRLELEVSRMIARMLGYDDDSWAHLTGGGTVANFEALWIARSVRYLPFVARDLDRSSGCETEASRLTRTGLLRLAPIAALKLFAASFNAAYQHLGANPNAMKQVLHLYRESRYNVGEHGIATTLRLLQSEPVVILPETAHYCLPKALDLLGIGKSAIVRVPVDTDFRMRVDCAADAIESAEADGKHVLAVVAVAGTTEEGAFDPVDELIALRSAREAMGASSFWIHADAAYGGYLRTITNPTRLGLGEPHTDVEISGKRTRLELDLPIGSTCDALDALSACDSIVVDPHKLGYAPYPAGAVCFRSKLVKPIARQHAPYIGDSPGGVQEESDSESIGLYILEGSKPGAAAASLWLSHSLISLDRDGLGQLMQSNIRNACEFAALLDRGGELFERPKVQGVTLCRPGCNIVCFAFRPTDREGSLTEINRLNGELHKRFSLDAENRSHIYDQRFFVSRTVFEAPAYSPDCMKEFLMQMGVTQDEYLHEGVFVLRSVFMNPWYEAAKRTGRYFLAELVGDLYDQASSLV